MKKRTRKVIRKLSGEELFGSAPVVDESPVPSVEDDGQDPFADSDDGFDFLLPTDPFATSAPGEHLDAVDRFKRAADAYVTQSTLGRHDTEKEEILRRIAAYWLRESKAMDAP